MKKRRKSRLKFSNLFWLFVIAFLVIVISFPKWIVLFYPQPHRDIIFTAAYENNIDPYLVFAIIRAESDFQENAESSVGAKGLMQIMPDTAQWISEQRGIEDFDPADLHRAEVNIDFGCWYLSSLNSEFNYNTPMVIAAYNAGRGTVSNWLLNGIWDGSIEDLDNIPFDETRIYVRNVLNNYQAYRAIYTLDK